MIVIVGKGNVGTHLFDALKEKTLTVNVDSRNLNEIPDEADIIIIAVSDGAIEEVARSIPERKAIIAHTSGSIPMNVLPDKGKGVGVFYPLQTFTKGVPLNYSEIPLFLEASNPEILKELKKTGSHFSNHIHEADSKTRKELHLASVFACNFTNALASISERLLKESGIDFSALLPLMRQTVDKLSRLSPSKAQTGPAVRGDEKVMQKHLEMLEGHPDLQTIYKLMSQEIIRTKDKNEI